MNRLLAVILGVLWMVGGFAQSFPYHVSVQTVPGHCYDDAHLVFTLTDDNGNEVQIDPQTHNAMNTAQYPLYNVQYHYQNTAGGGVQYDYSNDIMLMAGTYCVGVTANVPTQGGYALVDTTFCNVQITTSYQHLEASALSNMCKGDLNNGEERYGYWPSFHCKDMGRIQLYINQGSFPYEVTLLDEQQDTVRHEVFQHRVGTSTSYLSANYLDYYTFDNLPIGSYSITVTDSCGYEVPLSFNIPDYEPMAYYSGVYIYNAVCPDTSVIPFFLERRRASNIYSGNAWYDNVIQYVDSILLYRFINPGNDTTEWQNVASASSNSYGSWVKLYDTVSNYCVIFNDTVMVQYYDLCLDSLMTYYFKFDPQFRFLDSTEIIQISDTVIQDTCAVLFPSGVSTQSYKIGGDTWTYSNSSPYGGSGYVPDIPFRYYRCPLSYNVWSLPDSTLLGHAQSDEFTGLGTWEAFGVDTSVQVHVSVTDAQGCQLLEKDTVLVYNTEPIDSLLFWFETHADIDDDGKSHCCPKRYLWIQEHGVDANAFRRNMTLRLMESPLYNQFNFTAIRQNGVWTVTPDDPNNHSTYVVFSYEDGWKATVRDSACLAPGRYVFEVSTDCGVDTIVKEWAGYYYDTIYFATPPQYETKQICDQIVITQTDPGLANYVYLIDPSVSNDVPIQMECNHSCSGSSPSGGSYSIDAQGRNVYTFSSPGTYILHTYSYNYLFTYNVSSYIGECFDACENNDTVTVAFSYLDFETASALLCGSSSETGVVTAQAINGNAPYIYTLYDQGGAVIASNSTGLFDNVPMTVGQQFTVQVTDSCSTSFSINVTATQLTHESLLWEQGPNAAQPHCVGDSVHLTAFTFPPPATYQWTGPNGFSSSLQTNDFVVYSDSESGWYKVEILNSVCGSLITDSIYVTVVSTPQVSILGSDTVCYGGNVTLQASTGFSYESSYVWSTGDTTASITVAVMQNTEYTVTVTLPSGCSGSASHTVTITQTAPIVDTAYLCHNSSTVLTARSAATYLWSTGDTTPTISVSSAGWYMVTVTSESGCIVVDTFKVVTVKVNSISHVEIPIMCAGNSYPITVGQSATCNVTFATHETVLALHDTVFLPDGVSCGDPPSCSYRSPLTFAGYEENAHVNSVDDIRYVRINMEHSFAGDIYINLTCPNGQKADILKWGDYQMYVNTECASQISNSSKGWQSDVEGVYNASQGTDFGVPVKQSDSGYPCDATRPNNAFGTGWNYCWSNNTSEGYEYAGGTGSLIYRECNAVTNYDATPTYYWGVPVYPKSFDSSNVAAGTQFYHPDESFESLVGCPLNGSWYIEVLDGATVDNGYIFGWELALAEDIVTVEYADVTHTTVEGPWVTTVSDSSFLISPPANLPNDTVVNYIFHCYSSLGCGYDTVVTIHIYARDTILIDTTECNSLVWNGVTYTADTSFTDSLMNIHGCDSIITVNIHVITTPSVDITGPHFFCPGDTVTLTAATGDNPEFYAWSNGATTSSVVVTEAGLYTVTVTFAGGCTAESSGFHLFESENPIIDGFLDDMIAGDTQIVVIGNMAIDNLQYANPQSTLTYSTVTFLPDGVPCEPLGCSYKAEMHFSGFSDTAVIHSAEEIRYIRLKMEHSSPIDLYISLVCPNEQRSDILKKYNGNSDSPCSSFIDDSHKGWPSGNVNAAYNAPWPHKKAWMGAADITHTFPYNSDEDRCDPTKSKPGVGWNYCWSDNTTEGYQYASANGCLVDTSNAILYYNGVQQTLSHLQKIIIDSSNVAEGSQFYHPDESFDSLIGCPINGVWTVEVIDGIINENGYIFECEMGVAEHLASNHYASLVQMDFDSSWVTRLTDSTFIITPPEDLAHDTVVGYTFTLIDENGCVFDTTIYITIYAHKHTDLYDTVYADELPYEWNGPTLTHAGCGDTLLYTTHGADSVVTMHLSVIYLYDTLVCVNDFPQNWHGQAFIGVDSITVPHAIGCDCDSIEVLWMKGKPFYHDTTNVTICESALPYLWKGLTLYDPGIYSDSLTTAAGCDSIIVLNLNVDIVYVIPLEESICQGDTFFFFDRALTETDVYADTLQSATGCDSIILLTLTVNPVYNISLSDTICAGDTFHFFNQSLTTSGIYTETLSSISGCDSVITLTLVVNPTYSIPLTDTICQGDTLWFFDQILTSTGVYTEILQTAKGCDSVITLTLTVNPTYSIPVSEAICEGDTFYFHGALLTEAGDYSDTLQTVSGCDSVILLTLTVNPVYNVPLSDTICAGDTFHFFNQSLTTSGIYTETLSSVSGCDSVITLTLVVNPTYAIPLTETICQGDTLWFFDQILTETGVYTETLQTAEGCDSVITLTLTVNPTYSIPLSESICAGDTFYFHGNLLTEAGDYTDTLQTVSGCDSVILLTLTVNPVYNIPLSDTICAGDTFHFFNQSLTTSGVYTETLSSVSSCDSVITLTLVVNPTYYFTHTDTICQGDTLWFFDQILTSTGVYTETLQTAEGCDSVEAMHLTVNPNTSGMIVVSIVENDLPYEINQFSYDTAGTYIQHITNVAGCDSLLTIHLYVANNTITYQQARICQNMLPAMWHGHLWYEAGVVVDTLEAASGADSILVLTLSVGLPTESEIYDTILQNDLPYSLNESLYYAEGDYEQIKMNQAGCDSTITLHLTVLYNVRTELDTTVCDSLLPVIWNGLTFTEAGTDSVIYVAANGVDSTVVMTVNVKASSDSVLIVSVIENNLPYVLNGFEYNVSGTYTQNLDNAIDCDSTLTLVLTVLYNVRVEVDSIVCDSLFPITWNGVYFSGAGVDSVTIFASSGVDSTVVMTVTVAYPTEGTFEDTVVENNLPYQLNGYSYDSTGVYTQHLTNVNGCDSTLTFGLTVLYNVTSEADSLVCPSALPLVWNGKTFTAAGVQSAVLTAANGVDSTVTMTVTMLPSPTAHISGPSVLCADSYTTLTADSAGSYLWSNGMATQSIDVYVSGTYSVTVTNEFGCTAVDDFLVGNVVTVDPLVSINLPDLCAGESYTITAGYHTGANFLVGGIEETHSVAETVFLPDGIYCSPYGCSYQSPLTFTDFTVGSTVTNVNDIRYVRLNMEHSYAGDIYINITCPNGQKADIMKYAGTGSSSCTGTIPSGSIGWQGGANASQGTFFGMAYDYSTTSCNSSVSSNSPGVGWNYCWSNNTDQGYSYAPGAGSLIYRSVNAHSHPYAYGSGTKNIFDSSNVVAGTQFYHPDQSFASLIGCPLNGNWYIEVVDGYSLDNGYLFGWELALASTFATTNNTEMVAVTVEGPWVTMTDTTTFVINPPADLEHDTIIAYTVHFYDENGCGYDTIVFLNVYTQSHIAFDTTVCGSFVWNGTTYTQSQAITWNGVNAHGCDSTVAINLTVFPNPVTTVTGLPEPCVEDTAWLAAVCADTAALFVWSTGDTAQTITVTVPGNYTVSVSNAGGCTYETTAPVTFSSPTQAAIDTTVCDQLVLNGHTYTQTGVYHDTLPNTQGCDSVVTISLIVNNSVVTYDTLQLLQNQLPYYFAPHDTTFPSGSPTEFQFAYTLSTQQGCDSVIMQKVIVFQNYSQSFDTTVCSDAVPLTWHGHTYTTSGTVTDSLHTMHNSDSVITYTVTVNLLSATIDNVTHIVCYGDNTGAATATVTGGIAPLMYSWVNGAGASVSSTTQISNCPAGNYTFTVTDAAGCSATATVTLNMLHGQMLPGDISAPQTLCFGDTLGTVSGTAATGDGCTYQWQISTDSMNWSPLQGVNNTQNYTFQTPLISSIYLRRAWISVDCGTLYSDTLAISVWPVSSDTLYDDICVGQPYQEHGFDISETETIGLGTLTSWIHYNSVHGCDSMVTLVLDIHEPQETNLTAEICEGTGYYENGFWIPSSETVGEDTLSRVLNLQTVDGCDSVVRLAVTVIDTALRIVSPTADFCEDMLAELFVVTNMTDYEWSTGEMTPNITVTTPGVYKVTASEGGCSVTARYVIEPCVYQLYLPNAITPGRGEGLNDYFFIPELSKGSINLFEISIFNRWGELVFYSTDKNFQWNGEYKGKIYHQTVYNYIIEYTDSAGHPYRVTGSITVL